MNKQSHMRTLNFKLLGFGFLTAFIFFFTSCESYQTVSFVVKDSATQENIDSVYVHVKAGKNNDYEKSGTEGYTDSNGHFSGDFMIGCSFGCYDIFAECSKPGYKTYVSEMNDIPDTIWLTKE